MTDSPEFTVLHLLDHSLPEQDGYSFRTAALLREQNSRGWRTFQITSSKDPSELSSETVEGLEYLRTPDSRTVLARLPVFDQLDVVRSLERRVLALVDECRPDILQAHSPCLTGMAALRVSRRTGVPVVYEMRSSWEDAAVDLGLTRAGSLRYRVSRALETNVLKSADAVTTICDGLKKDIMARGIPGHDITVIPNAVDVRSFRVDDALRRDIIGRYGGDGIRLIGFIGTFFSWEGLDLLIDAVAGLARQRSDIRVLLVGGGSTENELKRRVAVHGLENIVMFVGRVPHAEVSSYYAAMDLLVYPRTPCELNEKVTPLKPLEAMAHRALILASDVGGHRELVTHDWNGLLFPAGNVEALSDALSSSLDHEDADRLCNMGRRFVEQERTWSRSVAAYAPVYRAVQRGQRT
jgi:PEP-CTERM/exosortase A-associated glycosyltransferase